MIQDDIREIVMKQAVEKMADALLASEGKTLDKFAVFVPEKPWPEGVMQFNNGEKFYILTPDGYAEVKANDWIIQTTDMSRYYIRFDMTE